MTDAADAEPEPPPASEPTPEPLLVLEGLCVHRPDGVELLRGVDLRVQPGEVIALLGGSGAGKSTLLGCIEDPDALRERGFGIDLAQRVLRAEVGIVPQRGALFDHLSVAGNLRLALRHAEHEHELPPPSRDDGAVEEWLGRMHLPRQWAQGSHSSTRLSGGEAQRIAVARTLAGGRRLLFLDEPSVGLDPYRVLVLAALLREQIRERGAAAIVITHDLAFAAAFADRYWFMDRALAGVDELAVEDLPSAVSRSAEQVWRIEQQLGEAVLRRLEDDVPPPPGTAGRRWVRALRDRVAGWVEPFGVPIEVLRQGPALLLERGRGGLRGGLRRGLHDALEVLPVVLKQTLLRPAPFFAIVSTLIGYSVLYIFHRAFADGDLALRDGFVFTMLGSRHIIALAPPLSGILFAATSGNAITAWLGSISLTRQSEALRGLGVSPRRYLWGPAWLGLSLSALLLSAMFVVGMVLGGALYISSTGVDASAAYELVTAQLLDPAPGDRRLLARAGFLLSIYAVGISADAVAKGARDKHSAEAVTASMVGSVMASTLWIVALELLTLPLVFG